MLSRIVTGFSLAFVFLALLLYLPLFYTGLIFTLISIYGFYEWLIVSNQSNQSILANLLVMVASMIMLLIYHNHQMVLIASYLSLFIWILILFDMYFGSRIYKRALAFNSSVIGLYMIITAWFLIMSLGTTSSVSVIEPNKYLLFSMSDSNIHMYLLFLIAIISLTDASGYFVGKLFGKKKLCEHISPNKTILGLLGSLLIPLISYVLIFIFILNKPLMIEDLLFMLLCCIYCTIGDLFVSTFKRFYSVKDTGKILPGHGGLLDRLDSYLPTISIFQIWLFI